MNRFKVGLTTATESISLVLRHKYLLFYLAIPFLAEQIYQQLLQHQNLGIGITKLKELLSSPLHMGISFVIGFVTILATIAIITHVAHILRRKSATIGFCLRSSMPKLPSVLMWAVVESLVAYITIKTITTYLVIPLFRPYDPSAYLIGKMFLQMFLTVLPSSIWGFLTFFITTHIALTKKGVFSSFRPSVIMSFKNIVEIIAGSCAYLLFVGLFTIGMGRLFILLMIGPLLRALLQYVPMLTPSLLAELLKGLLLFPFLLVLATAIPVFRTKLYLAQKKTERSKASA